MPDSLLQPWGIPSGIESENALIICISVSYEVKHGNVRWQAISKKPKEYFSKLVLHGPALCGPVSSVESDSPSGPTPSLD